MCSVYVLCSYLKSNSGLVSVNMGSLYFSGFFPVLLDDLQPLLFFRILRTHQSGGISATVTFTAMRFP